jgi:hypothetical protein
VVAAYHNKLAQGLADLLRANSKEIRSVVLSDLDYPAAQESVSSVRQQRRAEKTFEWTTRL